MIRSSSNFVHRIWLECWVSNSNSRYEVSNINIAENDDVLCGFVKAIQKILRPYDLIGRYGGEEFLIIVPDSTGLAEEEIYERVRAEIANHKIITRSGEVSITVSIGATSTRRDKTADEILALADEALYKAKDNGRNQVVFIEL